MTRTILVAGATGNQGGAVTDALLERPAEWQVRALTRKPGSRAARALADRGVEIVEGNLTDAASLTPALTGAYGVFSVQGRGRAEVLQGTTLADAAKSAGVQHLVYSSVGGVDRVRGIPHFDSKWQIERHLRDIGLPVTVLRPASYMEGFTMRGAAGIGLSMMAATLGSDKTLQMIAVRDIGCFARLAFEDPGAYLGTELEIAGDELTVPQIAAILRAQTGHAPRYTSLPKRLLRLMGKEARMFFWFGEGGYAADIPALRERHPDLLTFTRWLGTQRSGSA